MDVVDQKAVDALRFMSIDMIEKAQSGHPGITIDAAPMAYVLWEKFLNFNPEDDKWLNRDRFVLSAGHGSALLYSLLHFNKFDVTLDDIKEFANWVLRRRDTLNLVIPRVLMPQLVPWAKG